MLVYVFLDVTHLNAMSLKMLTNRVEIYGAISPLKNSIEVEEAKFSVRVRAHNEIGTIGVQKVRRLIRLNIGFNQLPRSDSGGCPS